MIYFTKGLPGCGKTHVAKQMQKENPDLVLVSKDDIRNLLFPGQKNFSRKKEELVKKTERTIVNDLLMENRDVVIHNTHLAGDHEEYYSNLAKSFYNTGFEVIDLTHIPVIECLKRNHLREHKVPVEVIVHMAKKYLPEMYEDLRAEYPDDDVLIEYLNNYQMGKDLRQEVIMDEHGLKPLSIDKLLLPCIICDIDGTLAIKSNRSAYDAHLAHKDQLNVNLAEIIDQLGEFYNVILLSGRGEEDREVTEHWLAVNGVMYNRLYMRAVGDDRPDSIVKRELYENHIAPIYYCVAVFDDRNAVIKMWREELRLNTLQCNYGDF